MGFGVLEGRQNFGIDVSKYLGFFFCLNFKLKYCGFFFFFWRFSFYKDVNLGLQFVMGLLITSLACEFSWIILAPTNPNQKKKLKPKTHVLVGSIRSHMIPHDSTMILNVLIRWDRKIVWSYDSDRDFDNHATKHALNIHEEANLYKYFPPSLIRKK